MGESTVDAAAFTAPAADVEGARHVTGRPAECEPSGPREKIERIRQDRQVRPSSGQDHGVRDERPPCDAIVREWWDEEGWGVVDSAETPGGCWVHFSHLAMEGFRAMTRGQAVKLAWESAAQDGYSYRAVRVVPL